MRLGGRLKRLEERASASTGSRSPRYELESYFWALEDLHVDRALEGVNEDIRVLTDALQHPRGT